MDIGNSAEDSAEGSTDRLGSVFNGAAALAFLNLRRRNRGQVASVSFEGVTAAGLYQLTLVSPALAVGDSAVVASFGAVASSGSLSVAILH